MNLIKKGTDWLLQQLKKKSLTNSHTAAPVKVEPIMPPVISFSEKTVEEVAKKAQILFEDALFQDQFKKNRQGSIPIYDEAIKMVEDWNNTHPDRPIVGRSGTLLEDLRRNRELALNPPVMFNTIEERFKHFPPTLSPVVPVTTPEVRDTKKSIPTTPIPLAPVVSIDDEITQLNELINTKYPGQSRVKSMVKDLIAAVSKENKKHSSEQWVKRLTMTRELLAAEGTPSPELMAAYHQDAMSLSQDKHSKTRQRIGTGMMVLAITVAVAAVFAVPFLSLAIAGVAALSAAVATATAATPFGVGAATSAFGGYLFFRKPAVARHMLALEQAIKISPQFAPASS